MSTILVEPVKDAGGSRGSLIIRSPTTDPDPMVRLKTPDRSCSFSDPVATTLHRDGGERVDDDGFHTVVSPQTAAGAAFHAHAATGKLKAEMTPTTPRGATPRTCGGGAARTSWSVRRATRQTDREIARVDHLLDLT